MTNNPLEEYFAALERLKKRNAKINNDTVALEAGRKKGSIKKSRPLFKELIETIDLAASAQATKNNTEKAKVEKYKSEAALLRAQLDAAYARELSLLAELLEAKCTIQSLTGKNVLPLRGSV